MIRVRTPGLFTTVQDLGRPGFGPMGVSASGAADPLALRIGNLLVGNPENAAGLEMTLLGGTFEFEADTVVALTGSNFDATIDQCASVLMRAGQILSTGPTRSGARAYLCVRGGIDVPPFLGSASTHILSGLGGFDGRALRKGDVLRVGPASAVFESRRLRPEAAEHLAPRKQLRVTRGPQWGWFPEASQRAFLETAYRVTEESNRMGLRLEGATIRSSSTASMITEGVSLGAIQIPANGKPIILFVEQQTTGGYPKIANIIAADLASVGQLRPRDGISFELVSPETARALICEQEVWIRLQPGLSTQAAVRG